MQYQAYPEYEFFASKSLGKCPKGWGNSAVKHCFDLQLGKMLQTKAESSDDIEMPYFKAQHVNWSHVNTNNLPLMWASPNDLEKYSVENGDLLVCEGGEVGRASLLTGLKGEAIIQNALHRVRNDKLGEVRFFVYVLQNYSSIGWFDILCNKATIAHLTGEKLGAIKIPLPSIQEQQKIADFLDYKTQQIDQLIEQKQALIEKLNEQRIAVITQAVTKGIDKNAKMKPSGVDWLGDVPEHWEVVRFSYFIGFQEGPGIMAVDFRDEGVPLLRIRNVQGKYIDLDACNYLDSEKVEKTWKHFRCNKGDLIISGSASTGLVCEVNIEAVDSIVYTGLIRLWSASYKINKEFIRWLVSSELFFTQIKQHQTGSTIQHFGPEHLNKMLITLPAIEGQKTIVAWIEKKLAHIDKMLISSRDAIKKLEEYRSALITAAVTGKIDIRNIELPSKDAVK